MKTLEIKFYEINKQGKSELTMLICCGNIDVTRDVTILRECFITKHSTTILDVPIILKTPIKDVYLLELMLVHLEALKMLH